MNKEFYELSAARHLSKESKFVCIIYTYFWQKCLLPSLLKIFFLSLGSPGDGSTSGVSISPLPLAVGPAWPMATLYMCLLSGNQGARARRNLNLIKFLEVVIVSGCLELAFLVK